MSKRFDRMTGAAAVALAVLFNLPFTILGTTFDYPDILRRPASEVLARFADGGAGLILTWHAFAWVALLFVPFSVVLAVRPDRLAARPALTVAAALAGALAGLVQAMGLWRWVFVIPLLAEVEASAAPGSAERAAAELSFAVLNQYGGVAIGEHMGQILTALFIALMGALQRVEGRRLTAALGGLAALAIFLGTGEGLALALGRDGALFGLVTVAGFLLFSLWLVLTGIGLLRNRQPVS